MGPPLYHFGAREIIAKSYTLEHELISVQCDLDMGNYVRRMVFNFDEYRQIEHYRLIAEQKGIALPVGADTIWPGDLSQAKPKILKTGPDDPCVKSRIASMAETGGSQPSSRSPRASCRYSLRATPRAHLIGQVRPGEHLPSEAKPEGVRSLSSYGPRSAHTTRGQRAGLCQAWLGQLHPISAVLADHRVCRSRRHS
jgi:hypothetical protein